MTEKLNDHLPTTPDVQAERLAELKRLFPDLFDGEGQLKLDEVKQLVGDEPHSQERYDFSWYGKRKAKETAYTPTTATLTYDEKRSVNPEKANGNVIIEGENLETVKVLLSGYREAIKCIYIDPPYNTGKDFVYSDNYTEDKRAYWEETGGLENGVKIDTNPETAGRYHSNWLSMMYSRLLLARQLLKDDGVIFVSIDDNEVHNLRRLMDDVFGEENFVAEFIWKSRQNKDNRTTTGVSNDHEYIICYSKNSEDRALKGSERKEERYSNPDNDPRGAWVSGNMVGLKDESQRPNLHYDLIDPETGVNYGKPMMGWRYEPKSMRKLIEENRVIWPDDSKGRPRKKTFLLELSDTLPGFSSIIGEDLFTRDGTNEIDEIFGFRIFDFPKPTGIISELVDQVLDDGDMLLDFFAGSGTSGHSLFNLNQEKGRVVKFILVQFPEEIDKKSEAFKAGYKKISDITIERNKRVVDNIIKQKKESEPDLFSQKESEQAQTKGLGFKVYQLTKSHFPRTEFKPDPEKTEAENIEVLKAYIKEKEKQLTGLFEATDIQDEVLLKNGFKLNYQLSDASEFKQNTVKLADDGEKQSLLCLDSKLDPETVKHLIKTPQAFICLERSLSTDDKWNLRQHLKHKFIAF